jgi:hypothetical protein
VTRAAEVLRFTPDDTDELLAAMDALADTRDGWVNLQPVPDEDEAAGAPVRAGVFNLFSGRGPRLPVGTWVPAAQGGRRPDPDSLGLQHAGGPKAARRLREVGVEPPGGATVLSDHPRRGLVLAVDPGTPPAELLRWLLAAAAALSPDPLPATWVAVVHHR